MQIESGDEGDKTREYIWKKSSHLATLVSQKLMNASKSMLKPAEEIAQNQTTTH